MLAAMGEVPRERFVPARRCARDAYRDGALPIGEGQTDVAALDRRLHGRSCWSCDGRRARARGGHRLRLRGGGAVARCAATWSRSSATRALADQRAGARSTSSGYDNVEVRAGDGTAGAPDRAPFDAISVTAAADEGRPPALLEQLAPGAPRSSARSSAATASSWSASATAHEEPSCRSASSRWSEASVIARVLGRRARDPQRCAGRPYVGRRSA